MMLKVNRLIGFGSGSKGGNDRYTKVLLHMDGTDASTTFTDSNFGGAAHTWTAGGNAQIDTGITKFGTGTGLFDGTTDTLTTPDHTDFDVGANDFTIDCWFNRAGGDGTNRFICAQSATPPTGDFSYLLKLDSVANALQFNLSATGTTLTAVTSTTLFTSTGWHHVAAVRVGDVLKLFVDGVQEGGDVAFVGPAFNSGSVLGVGTLGASTAACWFGSLDEFRLSVGIARWTANFTPPTAPYF
jgi:Concanavalin A-like lectin/glucanases superfamily